MTTLNINGMTCEHCVKAVREALESVPNAKNVQVDLDANRATVEGEVDSQTLIQAVANEGYSAQVA